MHSDQSVLVDKYGSQFAELASEKQELNTASFNFGIFRLACALIFFLSFYFFVTTAHSWIPIVSLLCIIGFLFGVKRQAKLDEQLKHNGSLSHVCQNEISCLIDRQSKYYNGENFLDSKSAYNVDLDLFGDHSLYEIMNRARTNKGIHYLASYLEELPSKEALEKRTAAVQELESQPDWSEHYKAYLWEYKNGHASDLQTDVEQSLTVDLSFAEGKALDFYMKALPFIWMILAVLYYFDVSSIGNIAIGLFIVNLFITGKYFKPITKVQQALTRFTNNLRKIDKAAAHILSKKWNSEILQKAIQIHQDDDGDGQPVSIQKLGAIITKLDYRLNLLVGAMLNGLVLWDLKIVKQLIEWKQNDEQQVYALIDLVGLYESLVSLGTWGYNHPHYTYAEITDDHFSLRAKGIYHPMIDFEENVPNDFEIKDGEYISILTGSNMSGKSTFLRTVGINLVLAYTGARTASSHLAAPLVKIITYMRIKDVLEESVSTFKAELNRIQLILDYLDKGEKCFYLIDEMLRGTNSYDKLSGSIAITKKLLQQQGYSMIATHDIKLAELAEEEHKGIKNYYFDIEFQGQDLAFDYKIKEGICSSFNASFLLNQLGLDIDVDNEVK